MSNADFDKATAALGNANAALLDKRITDARASLSQAYLPLQRHVSAGTAVSCIVSIQAADMSVLAGDLDLAKQFAGLVVEDVGRELERLAKIYKAKIESGDRDAARSLEIRGFTFTVSFVPFVKGVRHGVMTGDPRQLPPGIKEIFSILQRVRPRLDHAGWESWGYDPEPERLARYWAAFWLERQVNAWIDNELLGSDVAEAQQSLVAALELIQRLPEDWLAADLWTQRGRIIARYGVDYTQAIEAFANAVRINTEVQRRFDAMRDRSAIGILQHMKARDLAFNNRADEAERLSAEAERNLLEASAAARAVTSGPHVEAAVLTELNLGTFYSERKNWEGAARAFVDAWEKAPLCGDQAVYWRTRIAGNFGSALLDENRLADAEDWLRKALGELAPMRRPEPEAYMVIHGSLGRLLAITNRADEGYEHVATAVAKLESYRNSYIAERVNQALIKRFRWLYEALIDCCVTLGDAQPDRRTEAFETAERAKWRTLTTMLRYLPLGLLDEHDEPRVQEEEALLQQAIVALGDPVLSGTYEMETLFEQIERLWDSLAVDHPSYVAFRRQQTVRLAEAKRLLSDEVPVLVEYYFGDEYDTVAAFVIDRTQPAPVAIRLTCAPSRIVALANVLRGPVSPRQFRRSAKELFDVLVAPLLRHIPEQVGICVVPYGPLHNISFAALFDGKRYLVERNAIVIAPTASALRWWVEKDRQGKDSCLIFAATNGIYSGLRRESDLFWFDYLARKHIAPVFARSETVIGKAATKARLVAALAAGPDVIHIACHGEFGLDAADKGFSARLLMAGDPSTEKDLTALEIFTKLRVNSSLVTLSACEVGSRRRVD